MNMHMHEFMYGNEYIKIVLDDENECHSKHVALKNSCPRPSQRTDFDESN